MANPALPTQVDVAKACSDSLRASLDPAGTGAVNLNPGSDNAALVSMTAQGGGRLAAYVADRVAARDIDSASGSDLDDIARDLYKGEKRKDAAKAVGTIYLQRTNTAATSIPAGNTFGVKSTDTQPAVAYGAKATISVALNVLKVAVPVQCVQFGEVGNVTLAGVTDVLDPLPDNTWTVYVPIFGDSVLAGGSVDVIGGGKSRETDPEMKARLKQISTDPTPGTPPGVLKGALQVPGIVFVDVVEPFDGTTLIYAGDAGYQLPTALKATLALALESWRAYGSPSVIWPYNVVTVAVVADIYMATPLKNYDQSQLRADAIARIKAYFSTGRQRSDEYYQNAIEGAVFKSNEDVQQVILSSPATSQQRPADSTYGAITALNRYVVDDTSISLVFHDPLTT